MVRAYGEKLPALAPSARLAETAAVVGAVAMEAESSVWYGAVLRGDSAPITVGEGSNIQDNAVLHCDEDAPLTLGKNVTVGHGAILHGCTVEDGALIGMGAILLNHCVIGAGSLVAAGALVTQGTIVPPNSLVMGSPARVVRPLRPEEGAGNLRAALEYRRRSARQLPPAGEAPS